MSNFVWYAYNIFMEKDIWQYSLIAPIEHIDYIIWIKNKVDNCVLRADGEISIIYTNESIILAIRLPLAQKLILKPIFEALVAEIILNIYKPIYLEKSFDFYVQKDLLYFSFVKALCMFDYELDKQLISQKLLKYDKLNIQSFFDFCMKKLKDKWKELVMLANDNYLYLLSGGNFFELVKFLISNLNSKYLSVEVRFFEKSWAIYSQNKKLSLPIV